MLTLALPLRSETHWSDLLAVLIDTDPPRLPLCLDAASAWRRCR